MMTCRLWLVTECYEGTAGVRAGLDRHKERPFWAELILEKGVQPVMKEQQNDKKESLLMLDTC